MRSAAAVLVLVLGLVLVSTRAVAAPGAEPWDVSPFTADPVSLVQAAAAIEVAGNADVIVLLEAGHYRFDERGAATFRLHRIYKILGQPGLSSWAGVRATWAPWYQDQTRIRARVIDVNGAVHKLADGAIVAEAARSSSDHSYSDLRAVRAQFPAVSIGAIVEEELVYVYRKPYFDAGDTHYYHFAQSAPIHRSRLTIDAPAGLPIRAIARNVPGLARRKVRSGGRVVWSFSASELAPAKPAEPSLPTAVPRASYVAFSTGRSWADIARAYARIVDERIAAGDVPDLIATLPRAAGRRAVIKAALELVNDNVRYTGLHLGQSAIVPWTPKETWTRKYGDSKDKATLLVALLRGAGIPAHVALLYASTGSGIEAGLPGLGSFNHAIVHVPGPDPVWIDPTDELARAGELPVADQGRYAAIASAATTRLQRTPIESSAANKYSEVREIHLAEVGASRIVEITRFRGNVERSYRRHFRDSNPDKVREQMKSYVEEAFGASSLDGLTHSDPRDLDTPLELRLETRTAASAFTEEARAVVKIPVEEMLRRLPSHLTDDREVDAPRVAALALRPQVHEIVYRIHVPPGFQPRALPAARRVAVGPVAVTARFAGTAKLITATLTLDTGSGRLKPDEADTLRRELRKILAEEPIEIAIENRGAAHLTAGRHLAAVTEFRALATLHPKESLHRRQLAEALLAAGLGLAARVEARRAVALEPTSVDALGMLAWVLQHDEIGRIHGPGAKQTEALALYRKTIRIDAKAAWIRGNLAILLEHDRHGVRYAGDLGAAIAAYRELRAETGEKGWDLNLLLALFHAGRFDEVLELARSLPDLADAAPVRVAAAGALGGKDRMLAEAERLEQTAAKRAKAIEGAAELLVQARHYKLAAAALRLGASSADDPAAVRQRADLLDKITRASANRFAASDPRRIAVEYVAAVIGGPSAEKDLAATLASRGRTLAELRAAGDLRLSPTARRGLRGSGLTPTQMRDIVGTLVEPKVDLTVPGGWLVKLDAAPGMTQMQASALVVVRDRGGPRVLTDASSLGAVGVEALRLIDRGKLDTATEWLALARRVRSRNPFFEVLWSRRGAADAGRLRLVAASLMVLEKPRAARAASILSRCPRAESAVGRACDHLLSFAYEAAEEPDQALAPVKRLLDADPKDLDMVDRVGTLAWRAGDFDLAEAKATELLASDQGKLRGLRLMMLIAGSRGQTAKMVDYSRQAAERDDAESTDHNSYAWDALIVGDHGDHVLAAARRAVQTAGDRRYPELNTRAAVHAARGDYAEARDDILGSIEDFGAPTMRESDWLVYGRIAAGFGYPDVARAAYKKALGEPPDDSTHAAFPRLLTTWQRDLDAAR